MTPPRLPARVYAAGWLAAAVAALLFPPAMGADEAAAPLPPGLEATLRRYVDLPDALLPVLEAARDKQSADAAAPELQALLPRVYQARNELAEVRELSPAQSQTVRQRYEMQMRTRWGRVYEHIFRLQRARCYESVPFFKHFNTLCLLLGK